MQRQTYILVIVIPVLGVLGGLLITPDSRTGSFITLSKQTSYLMEPLREDGFVDYGRALNEMHSAGVTSENNAAVPWIRAAGPGRFDGYKRKELFKALGMDPLPKTGNYIISLSEFFDQQGIDSHEEPWAGNIEIACNRAWTPAEFPQFAKYLEVNEKPLKLLREGSRLHRFYLPIASPDPNDLILLGHFGYSDLATGVYELMMLSCMKSLGEGDVKEAMETQLAFHRMARLIGKDGYSLMCQLQACAIESLASSLSIPLLFSSHNTAELLHEYRKKFSSMDSLYPMGVATIGFEKAVFFERLVFLDAVTSFARIVAEGKISNSNDPVIQVALDGHVDWDQVLRSGNGWYDRRAAALGIPSVIQRLGEQFSLAADLDQFTRNAAAQASAGAWRYKATSKTEVMSELVLATILGVTLGGTDLIRYKKKYGVAGSRMKVISDALAMRATRGIPLPKALEELVPDELPQLPVDPFGSGAFRYQRTKGGFILYSLGRNREDDGGASEDSDDIVVRYPWVAGPR